jgi:hypothetical protein
MRDALLDHGYWLEAYLLDWYLQHSSGKCPLALEHTPWYQCQVWVGEMLPDISAVTAGDLWFDICDIMPMILLPRDPADLEGVNPAIVRKMTPYFSWLALRPVAVWQFMAFLEHASFAARTVQVPPPFRLMDQRRFATEHETAPITKLTRGEAAMYAFWFGKTLSYLETWRLVTQFLPSKQANALLYTLMQAWVTDGLPLLHALHARHIPDKRAAL